MITMIGIRLLIEYVGYKRLQNHNGNKKHFVPFQVTFPYLPQILVLIHKFVRHGIPINIR